MVTGVDPSPPRFLPSIFIAHRVQHSHCSSMFHRVLLTHALALFASQFGHKKKSQRIYTSMHSAGLELTKLTYNRLDDNLIRHRGDRYVTQTPGHSLGRLFSPIPTLPHAPSSLSREETTAFCSLVHYHRIAPTHAARRSQQWIPSLFDSCAF